MIIVSSDIQNLRGVGLEYLVDIDGNVLAKFVDGNIASTVSPRDPYCDTMPSAA